MCHDCPCPIPICISFGCPVKLTSKAGDGQARLCPKCNNASVFSGASRRWIELCFIPLIPCRSKDIWLCNICNWQAELGSFQPLLPNTYAPPPPGQPQMQMIPTYAPPAGPPPADQYPGGYGR